MTTKEEVVVATPAVTPAAPEKVEAVEGAAPDSEGLDAGFRKVRGEEPPADATAEKPAVVEPAKEAVQVTKPEPVKTEPAANLTKVELTTEVESLRKSIADSERKTFGKIGEIVQMVKELNKGAPATPAAAQSTAKVTKELLKSLNDAGYEDLAEHLAKDLSSILTASPASPVDAEALVKSISEKNAQHIQELRQETEKKLLTIRHKDWRAIYASDDFKVWKATLKDDERAFLDQSWESDGLGDALDDFKAWKAKAAEAKAAAEKKAPANDGKKKRLEAAITPVGVADTAASVLPDHKGLDDGFNKVRPARR